MTDEQKLVLEFHLKFGQPAASQFRRMTSKEVLFRSNFLREEVEEFDEAWLSGDGDVPGMVDALCDIIYVAHGTALYMGLDLEPFYREVHRTNMLKEGEARRSDGKILKPKDWKPPQIERLLRLQGWNGD